MPTYTEIIERLLTILDGVSFSGALLPEEEEEIDQLESAYYIQKAAEKN